MADRAIAGDPGRERGGRAVPRPARRRAALPGALALAGTALAAGLAFRAGLAELAAAWQLPEYSHGPLIPVISAWLFLRQLAALPPPAAAVTDRAPGAAIMLAALAIGGIAGIAGIGDVVAWALVLWIFGMTTACLGWARGRAFWPPVLHLVFMLPLPALLYFKTSIALQLLSSALGVAIIRAAGVPVYLDGNIIDLDVYRLHVAEACSGLRYLFPAMSFTYIFAVLYRGPLWIRGALLLAAVPVAIGMNALRVGVIGIMVDRVGIAWAESAMHVFEGWTVFGLCIGATLALAWALKRLSGERRPLLAVLDPGAPRPGAALGRLAGLGAPAALVVPGLVAALAGAAGIAAAAVAAPPPAVGRDPLALFPRALGDWRSALRVEFEPGVVETLGAEDYLSARYEVPGSPGSVDLLLAWYRDQTGSVSHSPEICIPGSGWEIEAIGPATVRLAGPGGPHRLEVSRAVIRNGPARQVVWHWFDLHGTRRISDYGAKLAILRAGLLTGRTDGALVRLMSPLLPGEDAAAAEARLAGFLAAAMPALPRVIATEWPPAGGATGLPPSGGGTD